LKACARSSWRWPELRALQLEGASRIEIVAGEDATSLVVALAYQHDALVNGGATVACSDVGPFWRSRGAAQHSEQQA